jgi:hypothetical protein
MLVAPSADDLLATFCNNLGSKDLRFRNTVPGDVPKLRHFDCIEPSRLPINLTEYRGAK